MAPGPHAVVSEELISAWMADRSSGVPSARKRSPGDQVIPAEQLAQAMKERGLTKTRMAELLHTSRTQVDRLLDPNNGSATLETLMRAAKVICRELRLELI